MAGDSHPPETFAARLKRLRAKAGLSQQELANLTGLQTPTIGGLETGRSLPGWHVLSVLAKALGATLGDFDGVDPGEPRAKPTRPRKPPAAEQ